MTPVARTPEERASDEVVLELPDRSDACVLARHLLRETFGRWGLIGLVDDAELAVSELVTNALTHGLPPVRLTIRQHAGFVRVDVGDARPASSAVVLPVSKHSDESGRGRGIIDAVSDDSGIDEIPGDGKSSYVSWDVDPPKPSAA